MTTFLGSYLLEQFELLHNTAGIPHSLLVKFPESLTSNVYSSKHRSNLAACIQNLSDVVDWTASTIANPDSELLSLVLKK
jgi:hypothetical protein